MIEQARDDAGIIDRITEIFERRGAEAYLGEDVTMAEHMLQCAALAESENAPGALVAAALLHDIGYFAGDISIEDTADSHHDAAGAAFLERFFPAVISETVRLHVAAKRYLCGLDEGYHAKLSDASKRSLALQGGPMSEAELTAFRDNPFYQEAVQVRLWDDGGKAIGKNVKPFAAYRPLLQSLLH